MTVLERVDPDAARAMRRAHVRCQCGRYLYRGHSPISFDEGACALCAGRRRRGAALVEDAEFLADNGHNLAGAAQQLHVTEGALERALYRHQRGDLVRRLRRPR